MSHPNKKVLAAGAAMVALSSFVPNPILTNEAMAQATATAVFTVNASVTNPLGIKQGVALDFGTFAVKSAGKVVLQPTGAETISGGFVMTSGVAGVVTITAPQSATFTLSVTDYATGSIKITNGGGGASSKSMTLANIELANNVGLNTGITGTVAKAAAQLTGVKVTVPAGTGKANIGGQLNFGANQVLGAYTGTYTMLITF